MKYYVVFKGYNPGVYDTWEETRLQTEGFSGAVYKSYHSPEEAAEAYRKYSGIEDRKDLMKILSSMIPKEPSPRSISEETNPEVDWDAWAVDASCLGNPGKMEYRGVELKTGRIIFQMGPFEDATNNIGEFLALVHAMALMTREGKFHNIYSDSKIAIGWVKRHKANTKLAPTDRNTRIFELLARATVWLNTHRFPAKIMKWDTRLWGEIPADYGRK